MAFPQHHMGCAGGGSANRFVLAKRGRRAPMLSRTANTLAQADSACTRFHAVSPVIPLEGSSRGTCAWQTCRPKLPWTHCHL
eukprot:9499803-Pyramimonas_sp.AAC.1